MRLNFKLLIKIKGNSINDCNVSGGHCYCSPRASSSLATPRFNRHLVPRTPHEVRPVFLYTRSLFPSLKRLYVPGVLFPRITGLYISVALFPRIEILYVPGALFPGITRLYVPGALFPRITRLWLTLTTHIWCRFRMRGSVPPLCRRHGGAVINLA